MAAPTSRATLIDYCKRRLGDPVVEINVDEASLYSGCCKWEFYATILRVR